MADRAKHPVQTTAKSLRIIEALKDLNGARIRDLEEELDMTKGAIHNHLSTLKEHEYVIKSGDEYHLSLYFLNLGGYTRNQLDLYKVGKSEVERLAEETGALVNLLTEEHGLGVYLYQARGEFSINIDTHVGYRIPLHNIALGKGILAELPEERVDEIVDKHGLPPGTEHTITDRAELDEELQTIRDQGYAVDNEERAKGLRCVAATIVDDEKDIIGAISISMPISRVGEDFSEETIEEVQAAANLIELEVRYS